MARTENRYPAVLRRLAPELREKALSLASVLLERGVPAERALAMSVDRALMWARHTSKPPQPHHERRSSVPPSAPANPGRRKPAEPSPRREQEAPPSNPRKRRLA